VIDLLKFILDYLTAIIMLIFIWVTAVSLWNLKIGDNSWYYPAISMALLYGSARLHMRAKEWSRT
jgi:hypothetical protein